MAAICRRRQCGGAAPKEARHGLLWNRCGEDQQDGAEKNHDEPRIFCLKPPKAFCIEYAHHSQGIRW
ncbi:unnamed protein product [Heligmosomoides polygyrus]|uniref:Uncharacterized protein n=1 Tax=Heligmosomoides polygyrus TaxID=6339 RepID=A0A183FD14_HELPZ|nr:unnamed protein product [Heligmosomoides polygyrus]